MDNAHSLSAFISIMKVEKCQTSTPVSNLLDNEAFTRYNNCELRNFNVIPFLIEIVA